MRMTTELQVLLTLGSIAIVPTIYRVILGQEKFALNMHPLGELFKMLFLTFYATLFFFQVFGRIR